MDELIKELENCLPSLMNSIDQDDRGRDYYICRFCDATSTDKLATHNPLCRGENLFVLIKKAKQEKVAQIDWLLQNGEG